jgi:hypothetical protein
MTLRQCSLCLSQIFDKTSDKSDARSKEDERKDIGAPYTENKDDSKGDERDGVYDDGRCGKEDRRNENRNSRCGD